MVIVRCKNEYIEDGEWKGNELTLNHINDSFIITHLNIKDQTYINKEFTKEELIRYLDVLYMQRIETGFIESCFNYLIYTSFLRIFINPSYLSPHNNQVQFFFLFPHY